MIEPEEADRISAMPTDELPVQRPGPVSGSDGPAGRVQPKPSRFLSGLAGVLVCVLILLAAGLIIAQLVSGNQGSPGPGVVAVGAHLLGAGLGVLLYRKVTRRTDAVRLVACLGLMAITGVLLWLFWWAA